ncbi:tesmin [Heteronotia binoei]|uniref:tesmin n=1 Tax=Heteronotia binoei TaxID=13085 RepID=UPI00292DA870|nr:tesmin [Heteronotia binoei]
MKNDLGQLDISTEDKHKQIESLAVPVENHVNNMDNGFVNEIFNQQDILSSEKLNMKSDGINKPADKFLCSQDTCLSNVDKATVDQLTYTLRESENVVLEVKMQPCTQDCDEDSGKHQRLSEQTTSEESTCTYLPQLQLHSYNIHFPSSIMMQHRNSVLSLGINSSDEAVNTNVEIIPVLTPSFPSGAGANNCVSCDQIKEIINSSVSPQVLPGCCGESCNGISTVPQDTAAFCDELAEVREAVVSIISNNPEEVVCQSTNDGEHRHSLPASQNAVEEPSCSQKNYSSPQVVIFQLKGGTHILCVNNTDTMKTVNLVPQYQDQHKYLPSDSTDSVTSVLEQFLPVGGKLNTCAQELGNGSLCICHPDSHIQEPTKLTLVGLPFGSWDTKSKKPCNCTKSQCLKLYCDCFASGDFCSNCNCNNCYNNPQHEIERFKAIKACLDRNPEAFLPKIGKGKMGDIKPRHNKGCNCKRSGCLKNYCECFEAKIMCSSICKCVGCKNYEESPDRKTLMNMPNYMEIRNEENDSISFSTSEILSKTRKDGQSNTCISWEVVEATCACLLAQAEEAEKESYTVCLAEQMILEEFGRCLSQILHSEFKSKGLKVE